MKRMQICAFMLALALLLTLAGCGGASRSAEPAGTAAPATAPPASAPAETSEPTETSAPMETSAPAEPPAPAAEPAPEDPTIHVSTAGEFLRAIAPGAVIELAPGVYNLSEYLREASDEISDCVSRSFTADGWQAEISGVRDLTIRGGQGGSVEVVAEPRYADVLSFSACAGIVIENITFGHTPEKGSCLGAVLAFEHCRNVRLDGLDLYGCGTYGVDGNCTAGMTLENCIIRDCSYGIVNLRLCSGVTFESCTFRDNEGLDMLSLHGSFALFDDCTFTGNEGTTLLPVSYYRGCECGASFVRCSFDRWESGQLGGELQGRGYYVIGKDCRFQADPGRRIVYAAGMEQLIESIAPDTQIMLAPGRYNLSDALSALSEQGIEEFNESHSYVRIDRVYDGLELVVTGVSGLTIASESGSAADTEIVTDPRYAEVLQFEYCSGTGIMNLTMGHTEAGDCSGDVLYFSRCSDTVLWGLDLYGCGVYGIGTDECALLTCFDSTIRDCRYGTLDLYNAQDRQMFLNCVMTGSGSGGFFYADEDSDGEFFFCCCTFGEGESRSCSAYAHNKLIVTEDCSWSEITDDSDYPEGTVDYVWYALDTACLKAAPFDATVLSDEYYYICYETVDRQSGGVSFETGGDVRYLTFEENGTGCFWEDDETGRRFTYVMDSDYSCVLSFDDGVRASCSLYADQGGALPDSREGTIWLGLYFDDVVLWFF